ncbi:hypothetical protein [Saliphagus infecundisoli]|uniref:PIN domain-containing protein n=1 Tax=Saliphagus infecundisoli TaxID=1849069 RepID=A0ABD5QLR2_9EURY|nr:hypothetical protein [Saliphagus infecundisoli]
MAGESIPNDSIVVIDSSVLFAMGGPSNEKYQAFERHVQHQHLTVRVPQQVAEELGESPDAYVYQRDRLKAAQDAGWLEPGQIDFTLSGVSTVVDKTRRRMGALSADDVTEDDIEKTDTILAGLAYQYTVQNDTHVAVLVSDSIAEQAIADALAAAGVEDRATVVEGRRLLQSLVD